MLQKISVEGVKRKVAGVFMGRESFEKNNEHRWAVFNDTEQVGEVTQAVYSPRLERNIGFALLDVESSGDWFGLQVESAEGGRSVEVTSLPFMDRDKKIPRASLRQG